MVNVYYGMQVHHVFLEVLMMDIFGKVKNGISGSIIV